MARNERPRTIVQKILDAHTVCEQGGRQLVYIDRLVLADTALGAFNAVKERGGSVRWPGQAMLVPGHFVPSTAAGELGMKVMALGDPRRGIQHVTSTEQANAQPGITVAGVDSHTITQGAVGALSLNHGTDLPHVVETQGAGSSHRK